MNCLVNQKLLRRVFVLLCLFGCLALPSTADAQRPPESMIVTLHGYSVEMGGPGQALAIEQIRDMALLDVLGEYWVMVAALEDFGRPYTLEVLSFNFRLSGLREMPRNRWFGEGHFILKIRVTDLGDPI